MLRWGADEAQLDGRGRSASDIAGALKNVFERGHRHAEKVKRIKVLLANAPRDRRWIRRRAVVMLVSRLRGEISRERSGRRSGETSAAKKRGGGAADGAAGTGAPTPAVAELAAQAGQAAAAALETQKEEQALCGVMRRASGGMETCDDGVAVERPASLPQGMEAFRDVVLRLGAEDDVGIFRSVVGFL